MKSKKNIKGWLVAVTMIPVLILLLVRNYTTLTEQFQQGFVSLINRYYQVHGTSVPPLPKPWTGTAVYFSFITILILLTVLFLLIIKARSFRGFDNPRKVIGLKNRTLDSWDFFVKTMIPMAVLSISDVGHLVFLLLYYVLFTCLLVRMPSLYTNPILAVMGFHLYDIQADTGEQMTVLSLGKVKLDDSIILAELEDNVFFSRLM